MSEKNVIEVILKSDLQARINTAFELTMVMRLY